MDVARDPESTLEPTEARIQTPASSSTLGLGRDGLAPQVRDLSSDKLIASISRIPFQGVIVPAIGGIPLLSKLGQGGMGAVYYGVHPRLMVEVAVKILPFHLADRAPEMVQRFLREAQTAARVRSPHLVGVLDVNQEAGIYFLVMEFVRGKTAGGYLKALRASGVTGLPEAEALDICIAATTGLVAAHKAGIIHRDIKPDNILIPFAEGALPGSDGPLDLAAAKLSDLGLARSEGADKSLTGAQACLGTPGYMSLEQTQDAKKAGKPADVFGMAAALYALLSGHAPFRGSSVAEIIIQTAKDDRQPVQAERPDVSPQTAALLERCLSADPAQRCLDGSALLQELRACRAFVSSALAAGGKGAGVSGQSQPVGANTPTVANAPPRTPAAVEQVSRLAVPSLTSGKEGLGVRGIRKAPFYIACGVLGLGVLIVVVRLAFTGRTEPRRSDENAGEREAIGRGAAEQGEGKPVTDPAKEFSEFMKKISALEKKFDALSTVVVAGRGEGETGGRQETTKVAQPEKANLKPPDGKVAEPKTVANRGLQELSAELVRDASALERQLVDLKRNADAAQKRADLAKQRYEEEKVLANKRLSSDEQLRSVEKCFEEIRTTAAMAMANTARAERELAIVRKRIALLEECGAQARPPNLPAARPPP